MYCRYPDKLWINNVVNIEVDKVQWKFSALSQIDDSTVGVDYIVNLLENVLDRRVSEILINLYARFALVVFGLYRVDKTESL